MYKPLFLLLVILFSCRPYEYIEGEIVEDPNKEVTDGVIVYSYEGSIHSVNDLGDEDLIVPNTNDVRGTISLSYDKSKIAYRNTSGTLITINIDGSSKETLTQYDVKGFEWSKKEDVLFLFETGSNVITTHGASTSFVSPILNASAVSNFTISKDYDVAYWYPKPLYYNAILVVVKQDGQQFVNEHYMYDYNCSFLNFSNDSKRISGFLTDYIGTSILDSYQFNFDYETNTGFGMLEDDYGSYVSQEIIKSEDDKLFPASVTGGYDSDYNYPDGVNLYRKAKNRDLIPITYYPGDNNFFFFDWKK